MILEITASALLSVAAVPTRASGETARYVASEFGENRRRLKDSNSLGMGMTLAIQALGEIASECRLENWDGYGASGIDEDTLIHAYAFLEALPFGTPAPSVGAEPDGHLTLEWYKTPRLTLSVSISPERDLHYAALIGPSRAYGTEPFLGEIPQTILDLIHRVDLDKSRP